MPVNFPGFKSNLKSYFEDGVETNTLQDTAKAIVDEYIAEIVEKGADPVSQNTLQVIPPKQQALEAAFVQMFTIALETNTPLNLGVVAPALITFWTGGLLTLTGLIPGTIQTVSAVVTVPGVATPIPFPPAGDNVDPFLTTLETFFQTHLLTVQFLITGLVPAPPAPPIPTPFPSATYV